VQRREALAVLAKIGDAEEGVRPKETESGLPLRLLQSLIG
jgi:hypothetical protein